MITFAPAKTNPLVVSRPMPEYPPVTIATLSERLISLRISDVSDFELKPEFIGF